MASRALGELLRFGLKFRGLRGRQIADLVAFTTGSLGEFLDRSLDSPHLKSLMLANSLYGKHGGPYDPGTLFGLLFHLLGGGAEAKQGFVGHVMGGMGAITQAMAAACAAQGVEMRTDVSRAASVDSSAAARRACVLADGCRSMPPSSSRTPIPKRTFLELVEAHELDEQFLAAVRGIKMDGPCGKFNLVLAEEPRLRGGDPDADALRNAQFTLVPWLDGAQRCYESARQGGCTSSLDRLPRALADRPSLATPGRHVMTCFVQYLPGKPTDGWKPRASRSTSAAGQIAELRAGGAARWWRAASIRPRTSKAPSASPRATSFTATCGPTSCSSCGRCRRMRATRRRSARCTCAAPARIRAAA